MLFSGFNPLHCGAVVASKYSITCPIMPKRFNPLHCGAVVASTPPGRWRVRAGAFQSPSLRGSGRFPAGRVGGISIFPCFNPLHCGAVVASMSVFYLTGRPPHRFNPLHCGAVVASLSAASEEDRDQMSQSPSLRGSGRFGTGARKGSRHRNKSLNPLHCGAVVASSKPLRGSGPRPSRSQSPSLRGSGRFGETTYDSPSP